MGENAPLVTDRRRSRPRIRPILFLIVLCLLGAAGLYAFTLLRGGGALSQAIGPGDPSLNPVERIGLSAYLQARAAALSHPAGPDPAPIQFEVLPGETAGDVAARLAQLGLIPDSDLLAFYMRYNGLDAGIEAGHFTLQRTMTVAEIAGILSHATPTSISLRVTEGWRAEQIAASLEPAGLTITAAEFLGLLNARPIQFSFVSEIPGTATLEGFLFPDTYTFDPDAAAFDVLATMLQNFDRRLSPEIREAASARALQLYDVVTLASIVEREAVEADERPLIASVFSNRLALGMRLEADPTVQYAVSQAPNWWKRPLTIEDLNFDSPYNTYLYLGLPPGPIANPGLSAIQAVIYSSETPYLYFRARCDGSGRHEFSVTYEEHLSKGC